ncbi:hypothetical protein LTR36_001135 [Oleoguttula mirabilis]|uniref:Uncharacterized protein n=1 Tax=Oleoguttula mirabilis TaxID=1507867 RepID=A0AAV9JPZ8_9PEZI|nr:hypothetical protein LTR36_001135 [Oleoguttula mirabilis]
MHAVTIAAASFAALAAAVPHAHSHRHAHAVEKRDGTTFGLTVVNNCTTSKTFGLYQVSSSFAMTQMSDPVEIESEGSSTIQVAFTDLGMRLSATADLGTDAQWDAQTLFEFGYSTYLELTGTAYDLSVMDGGSEGIAAYPATSACESKICSSAGCTLAEAWTNADEITDGSPADTVCYEGMQDFKVVWCPS